MEFIYSVSSYKFLNNIIYLFLGFYISIIKLTIFKMLLALFPNLGFKR